MKTLQIEITKEDVENALRDNATQEIENTDYISICYRCPTHYSLRRYMNCAFFVTMDTVGKEDDSSNIGKFDDTELAEEVDKFTSRKQFNPGTYTIEVDEAFLKEEYK